MQAKCLGGLFAIRLPLPLLGGQFSALNINSNHLSKLSLFQTSYFSTLNQSDKTKTTLQQINGQFLDAHKELAPLMLLDIDHVVVYLNGEMSLWKRRNNDTNFQKEMNKPSAALKEAYSSAKMLAHIPVSLVTILAPIVEGKLSLKNGLPRLEILLTHLYILKTSNDKNVKTNFKLIDQSIILIEKIKSCKNVLEIKNIFQDYQTEIKDIISELSQQATNLQLRSLKETMTDWIKNHDMDLTKTRVLIVGPHGPRDELIEHQYFENLYRENSHVKSPTNQYIYYVEMLPQQMASLDISKNLITEFLSGQELNKQIGKQLLNDETAMSKELLWKQGKSTIKAMNEEDRQTCPYKLTK